MLYRPEKGNMWDTSIVFHHGRYYLFSMYESEDETENSRRLGTSANNVWCAVSENGVVWTDVGAVIKDQPFVVWKMFVRKLGDRFAMNHGSFSNTPGHGNDTLYFWQSKDLVSWQFLGLDKGSHPDPRWYDVRGRWDHMYMLPDEHGRGYHGYCVATTCEEYPYHSCGLVHSEDGCSWEVLPPVVIDWKGMPQFPGFEVGGCEKEAGKYYLIGGLGKYAGSDGYGVYTLVSDHWNGPFRPDAEAYRLCGSSGYSGVDGVQWLASLGRGRNGELLITNYLTDYTHTSGTAWGCRGHVWFLPIKKAVIDEHGHLHMGYWRQNDLLKGRQITPAAATLVYPTGGQQSHAELLQTDGSEITIETSAGSGASFQSAAWRTDRYAIVALGDRMDLEKGVVMEGSLEIVPQDKWRPSRTGFYFEETPASGTYLLLEAGHARWRKAEIGVVRWGSGLDIDVRDTTQYGCATVSGLDVGKIHTFRVLYRKNMFEVYVDDLLVQTFITSQSPTGRIGLIAQNARCAFWDVHLWEMVL